MEAVVLKARQAMQEVARSSPDLIRAALERSKDMAAEATKRAGLALDGAAKAELDEQELSRYGITPELRDFVQGLTIDTFRDFPLHDNEMCEVEQAGDIQVPENSSSDLSPWQEQHARLVLSAVPEMSDFRYKLCPKFIKEKRFWRIYFTLVAGHIASCHSSPVKPASPGQELATHPHADHKPIAAESRDVHKLATQSAGSQTNRLDDQELDAYLMGAGSSDEEEELNDQGFDAEFEQFVKDAALQTDDDEG